MTAVLCVLAILTVNLRNEQMGLLLVIIGIGALILVHKIGYLEYLSFDKLYGWFKDVTDFSPRLKSVIPAACGRYPRAAWSLWLDIKILFKTVRVVFNGDGR